MVCICFHSSYDAIQQFVLVVNYYCSFFKVHKITSGL